MSALQITEVDNDETPPVSVEPSPNKDPEYPGSTPDAPYGFKDNGEPYKRRPYAPRTSSGKSRSTSGKSNDALASSAARMLCQINSLVGMSLTVFGMPQTAMDIEKANSDFETMATESLRTDPALCRKILSAGATSGRTGLTIAYIYLAGSAFPSARSELQAKRREKDLENDNEYA